MDRAELQNGLQDILGAKTAQEVVYGMGKLRKEELLELKESFEALLACMQRRNVHISA